MQIARINSADRTSDQSTCSEFESVLAIMFLDRIIWFLAALILAGALSGCSTLDFGDKVWYKEGGTVEERDRLLAASQLQATQAHAAETPGGSNQTSARAQSERQAVLTVMTAAGWRLVPKSEAGPLENAKKTKAAPRSNTSATALDR